MRVRALWVAAGLAVGLVGGPARAGVIYATGFEDPPFAAGSQLLGQDGWTTAIPGFLNPAAGVVTDAVARTGRQSLEVRGVDLLPSGGPTAPYDAVGSYRRPVNYTVGPDGRTIRVEADLRIDGPAAPTATDFFSVTIAARSGDGETLGEFGLSSMGVAAGYGFGINPGDPPAVTAPIALNRWYHLAMALDFAGRTTSYYLDGALVGTVAAPSASNVLLRAAVVVYALPDAGPDARADYTARADNFSIAAVPEPGSVGLLAAGGLVLLGAARRRAVTG